MNSPVFFPGKHSDFTKTPQIREPACESAFLGFGLPGRLLIAVEPEPQEGALSKAYLGAPLISRERFPEQLGRENSTLGCKASLRENQTSAWGPPHGWEEDKRATTNVQHRFVLFFSLSFLRFRSP